VSVDYNYSAPAAAPLVITALGGTQEAWVDAIGDGYQMAATATVSMQGPAPATSNHVYVTAAYVLNEAGAWLG
jgi:hypothetical protein